MNKMSLTIPLNNVNNEDKDVGKESLMAVFSMRQREKSIYQNL